MGGWGVRGNLVKNGHDILMFDGVLWEVSVTMFVAYVDVYVDAEIPGV